MAFLGRIKKLASETAIYGISTVVGRMINFLMVPLYVAVFEPGLYGVVGLVYTTFLILNHVYQHGMESSYLKFASGKEGRARKEDVFSTASWSLLAVGVVLSGLIVALREDIGAGIAIDPRWSYLFYYVATILLLDTLAIVPFAELRLQNRPFYFAAIKLINIFLNVGANLLLILWLKWGIEAIFVANLIASAGTLVLLLPLYLKLWRGRFDKQLWRQLMAFGLPFLPSGLSYAFVDRINLYFLNWMEDEEVMRLYGSDIPREAMAAAEQAGEGLGIYVSGIFNAIWKLGVFMMLVSQMFRFAWQPFFLQHAEDEDAKPLFARIFTFFTAGAGLVLLAVAFFIDELVALPLPGGRTLINHQYWLGLYVVPIALLAYVFQGWYYNFMAGAYIEKQTRYFVICTFAGAIVSLTINIFFVPHYGMTAAAWATTLAYATMAILLFFIVRRFYLVPYDLMAVLRIALLGGGLFYLWYSVPALQVWWIEALLILGYVTGLFVLRILPWRFVRQRVRRN